MRFWKKIKVKIIYAYIAVFIRFTLLFTAKKTTTAKQKKKKNYWPHALVFVRKVWM